MNAFVYFCYVATIGMIRIYKKIELSILQLFSSYIKKEAIKIAKSVGIIIDCTEESEKASDTSALKHNSDSNDNTKYRSLVRLKVNSIQFFPRLANLGTLGLGEAFMDGTCDIYNDNYEDITEIIKRIFENNLLDLYYNPWNSFLEWLELHAWNLQTCERAFQVGKVHYDLGNDLFETMLDPWMQYTCGYWKDCDNLNDAQINKMDLIARKMDLKPGMRVLDIGCGWGGLCKYLSEKYKVECVGVTIGKNGAEYGNRISAGLPVEIRVQDYRQVEEKFDRIVSVGMFEHVGFRNYREFFKVCNRCLKDDGILVLHTIARNHSNVPRSEPWGNKYIFPNGNVPNPKDIAESTSDLFVIEDLHNFGLDYAKTLYSWRENFVKGWPQIQHKYGKNFFRMWTVYLSTARGLFLARKLQLWQIVLTKDGLKREYRSPR